MTLMGSMAGSQPLGRWLKDYNVTTSEHSTQMFSLINFDMCDGGGAPTKLQHRTFPPIPKFSCVFG